MGISIATKNRFQKNEDRSPYNSIEIDVLQKHIKYQNPLKSA